MIISCLQFCLLNLYCYCSVTMLCLTLYDLMNCSTPGFSVLHYLPKFAQTHIHWVDNAKQPYHPLSPPSPPALNLSQHQGLFQWVNSSHQVAKGFKFQLQHQSFQSLSTQTSWGREKKILSSLLLTVSVSCPTDEILYQQTLDLSFFISRGGIMSSFSVPYCYKDQLISGET